MIGRFGSDDGHRVGDARVAPVVRYGVAPLREGGDIRIAGVAGGVGLFLFALAWGAALGHGRFSDKTMRRIEISSGIGLLALGVIHGAKLAYHLAKTKGF